MTQRRRTKYGLRTVGTAQQMGLDPDGGKWVVTCDDHHTVVNVDTKAVALGLHTNEFCDECEPEE
jgi:hypothetical protein